MLAAAALLGLTSRPAHAQEKWQPELVISQVPGGPTACDSIDPKPLCFPDQFSENAATGDLLVADTHHNRVLIYDSSGIYKAEVNGAFAQPYGVVADADGNIIVANTLGGTIEVFDSTGQGHLSSFTPLVPAGAMGPYPYRVHLAPGTRLFPPAPDVPTGTLYVVDGNNNLVSVYDASWNLKLQFGGNGSVPGAQSTQGDFNAPTGLAVDSAGRIYVVDPNIPRLAIFDDTGRWLADLCNGDVTQSGTPCTIPYAAGYPFGVAVDAQDRVLIADGNSNYIAVFSPYPDLTPLNVIIGVPNQKLNGPAGCTPDMANPNYTYLCNPDFADGTDLQQPVDITLDSQGRILVADSGNMRVTRFGHTLSLSVTATPARVAPSGAITVSVTAFTGAGFVTNVLPTVLASNAGLVTDVNPTSLTYNNGLPIPPGGVRVDAGSPVIFTATYTAAASGSGALQFTAGATGVSDQGVNLSALAASSSAIAINPPAGSVPPQTTASAVSGSQFGNVLPAPAIGWFIGLSIPQIQLTATGNPLPSFIDYQFSGTDQAGGAPSEPCATPCTSAPGSAVTVQLTGPGRQYLWFRARNDIGDTEQYNVIQVAWENMSPAVAFGYTPDLLWSRTAVDVHYTIIPGASGMPVGTPSSGTHTIVGEGAGITWSLTGVVNAAGVPYDNPVDHSSTATTKALNIDKTKPTIDLNYTLYKSGTNISPAPPQCVLCGPTEPKWYNTPLDIVFTATDPLPDPSVVPIGATRAASGFPQSLSATGIEGDTQGRSVMTATEGAGQSFTAGPTTFIDRAGNGAANTVSTATINIDTTLPSVTASLTGTAGTNGWYTSDVTVTFNPFDALSGVQKVHYDVYNANNQVTASGDLPAGSQYSAVVADAGKNTVKFYAADKAGNQSATSSINVWISRATQTTLVANPNPVIAGQPLTLTATVAPAGATGSVTFSDGATVLGSVLLTGNTASLQTTTLAIGPHTITATYVPDTVNYVGSVSAATLVEVTTNRPPVCTATASPGLLWPPNHRFATISIRGVADPDGDPVTIVVDRIWQDESTMADGSGDTPIDGQIVGGVAQVRAERSGEGDGRVYQIFFTATDSSGASCTGSVTVGVPHDQRGQAAVDSGVRYDSLVAGGPPVAGTPPNRQPVAKADTASTLKGIATTIAVLANDSDPDGNTLMLTAVTTPAHGTAVINANGTITYTPVAGYDGTDTFTYTVSDGHGGTATAKVTVKVRKHFDGDGCEHDRHRKGRHDSDGSDHDKDTRRRGDDNDHRDDDDRGDDRG